MLNMKGLRLLIGRLGIIALLLCLLLGCSLQSAPTPSVPIAEAPSTAVAESSVSTPEPVREPTPVLEGEAPTSWTIGLLDEPANVLPFSPDGRAAAPIVEAMFPAPVLGLSYAYTTTGVLESLPSVSNGDVQVQDITGFLDATGQFTLTETTQPTTTQQLTITYRWSDELRWADGQPVTAADSIFSFELMSQVQASQEAQLTQAMVERYEQIDEHTTRAVLKPGRTESGHLLTAWPPLPQHRLQGLPPEEALAEIKRQPLGYGPYTFAEQIPGQQLELTRNDYWPQHEQLPERLVFRFYASAEELRNAITSGEVDVATIERIPEELYAFLDQDQQSGAAEVTYLAGPIYEHLDFNLGVERLQEVRVRKALAYALDREAISTRLFSGKVQPLHSWILPDQSAFYAGDEQLARYPFDPSKALALLDETGLTDRNGDGVRELPNDEPFTLTLLTTDTPLRKVMAEQIAESWRAVGIQAQVESQPVEQFYSPTGPLYRRDFQVALFAWIAGVDPGGLPLWSCNAVPMQENNYTGNNFSGWCFEAAEWPLRRANAVLDTRVRAQEYLKHQRLWTQELPSVPLFQRPVVVLQRPGVQGVQPDAIAPLTWNISNWQRR
jgi:peptide/nickel transport system substrate-binding protein